MKHCKNFKLNPQKVDWENSSSVLFFNQWHSRSFLGSSILSHLPELSSHIWLMSSGRQNLKLVALSKKAILCSAHSVNNHLNILQKDRWGICLPIFHIGGLAILARAYLSQSDVFYFKSRWSVPHFISFLKEYRITLVSLVPSQVYDLVRFKVSCPVGVRCVLVGGSALNRSLYLAARQFKWPLLPTYGMTECSSQVATADLSSLDSVSFPRLKILPHIQVKIKKWDSKNLFVKPDFHSLEKRKGIISIQSGSLLTGFVYLSKLNLRKSDSWVFQDPKRHGWYQTQDLGIKESSFLKILPQMDQIKILGEKVSFKNLEEKWMQILLKNCLKGACFLLAVPNLRSGFDIILVANTCCVDQLPQMIREFNHQVLPFERIKNFYFVPSMPTSSISKVLKKDLWKMLGFLSKKGCVFSPSYFI